VALDVLDHDDRVVDHQAHREHDREEREQVQREAEHLHQEHAAHQRQRDRHHRDQHGAHRAEEQEDHHDDDRDRLEERLDDLGDRRVDVLGGVERDARLHAARQLFLQRVHLLAHLRDDVDRVGVGQHPHAHEDGALAREADLLIVGVGAEHDVGHVLQPHQRGARAAHHQALELLHGVQIGRRRQVQLHQRPFGLADRREVAVLGQRLAHLAGAHAERGHPLRLQPRAQREGASAEDLRALHARDRREARLHDADQVVGDLVVREDLRAEAQVHRRERGVARHDRDRRDLGLGRQIGAHLGDAGVDVGERRRRVGVDLEPHLDRRAPLDALRLDVVDAARGRDRALERRGDEAAHQIGARSDVDRRHGDRGRLDLRVLPDVERADRLHPGDQDDQVDHQREDRTLDEEVGELHAALTGSPAVDRPTRAAPRDRRPRRARRCAA
jgi:hypothetical protein